MKALIIIDMQNDFIDGSLGTPEAQAIVPAVADKIRQWQGLVVATQDTHQPDYLKTQEGMHLPVEHCIAGTHGWDINPLISEALQAKGAQTVAKPTFGSTVLAMMLMQCGISEIHLAGLCTDICVVSNALLLKAMMPEVPIYVDTACCAGVTPEKHNAAVETMRSCQINII